MQGGVVDLALSVLFEEPPGANAEIVENLRNDQLFVDLERPGWFIGAEDVGDSRFRIKDDHDQDAGVQVFRNFRDTQDQAGDQIPRPSSVRASLRLPSCASLMVQSYYCSSRALTPISTGASTSCRTVRVRAKLLTSQRPGGMEEDLRRSI
jgi:hypothetical protein